MKNLISNGTTLVVSAASQLGDSTITSYGPSNSGDLNFNNTAAITIDNDITGSVNVEQTSDYPVELSGNISGNVSVKQDGNGALTLSGNNSYTGLTNVYSGTLMAGSDTALPSGPGVGDVWVSTGTLDLNGHSVTINGLTSSGTVTNSNGSNPSTLAVGMNDASSTFDGDIEDSTGTVALTKVGDGTFTLTGNNDYHGGTLVNGGILLAPSTSSLPDYSTPGKVEVNAGGTIAVHIGGTSSWSYPTYAAIESLMSNATFNSGSALGISNSSTLTYPNTISGSFAINVLGSLIFDTPQSYSGGTIIQGRVELQGNGTLGGGPVTSDGTYLPTLTFNYSTDKTFANDITGNVNVTQEGAGVLTLSGDNTYTGTTTIDTDRTLLLGSDNALGSGTLGLYTNSTLNLNGHDLTVYDFSGTGTITAASADDTLTVGDGTTTCSGTLQDGTGTLSVTKSGSGTLTLSGTKNYTGTTTVDQGTIDLGASWTNPSTLLVSDEGVAKYNGTTLHGMSSTISGAEMVLSWHGLPTETGTTYEYQASFDGGTNYQKIMDVDAADLDSSLMVTGLPVNTSCYQRVVAYQPGGKQMIYDAGPIQTQESPDDGKLYRIRFEYSSEPGSILPSYEEAPAQAPTVTTFGPGDIPVQIFPVTHYGFPAGQYDPNLWDDFTVDFSWVYADSPESAVLQSIQDLVFDGSIPEYIPGVGVNLFHYRYTINPHSGPMYVVYDYYSYDGSLYYDSNPLPLGGMSAVYTYENSKLTIALDYFNLTDSNGDPCDPSGGVAGGGSGSGSGGNGGAGPAPDFVTPSFNSNFLTLSTPALFSTTGTNACACTGAGAGLTYNSGETDFDTGFGQGWGDVDELPELVVSRNILIARFAAENIIMFEDQYDGTYTAMNGALETLVHDSGLYTLTKTDGTIYEFFDGTGDRLPGSLYRSIAPDGTTIEVTAWDSNNNRAATVLDRTSPTGQAYQKREFTYTQTDDGVYRIQTITLLEYNDGATPSWDNVRKATYDYYDFGSDNGSPGDLRSICIQQWDTTGTPDWATGDTSYFRYYTDDTEEGYFEHGLKRILLPEAYEKAVAYAATLYTTIDHLTDTQITPYTCFYYKYDSEGRVTEREVFGETSASSYAYTMSDNPNGYNSWHRKSVETQLDGTTLTNYTNYLGSIILSDLYDPATGEHTLKYTRYDDAGRKILSTDTSAFQLYGGDYYDESLSDLIGYDGDSDYLNNTDGLFQLTTYYTTTGSGAAEGYIYQKAVAQGETGTSVVLADFQYVARTVGSTTLYVISSRTTYDGYAADGNTDATVEFDYTWQTGSFQPEEIVMTLPAVSAAQNGSGTSDTMKQWHDSNGNLAWTMDGLGRVTYMEYEVLTGQVTRVIEDIDAATVTSESLTSPAGWTLPASGAVNAITEFEYDIFGRVTQTLGPEHIADVSGTPTNVRTATWTVYDDINHETRSAQGYVIVSTSAAVILGPVSITKTDRDGRVTDQIEAAYSDTVANLPTATIAQTDYTAWTTYQYYKTRLTSIWVYDDIPTTGDGTQGTNYEVITYGYESYTDFGETNRMGRMNKTVTPDGTITRNVFDYQGNIIETWVGTDETGATDDDPSGTGSNDMVKIVDYTYDSEGRLTSTTEYPGGSADNITTTYQYDWLGRVTDILTSADVVTHYEYDNLGRAILTETYASDDFTLAASELRAKTVDLYDALDQTYETHTYEVDPSDGTVGSYLTTEAWYDAEGHIVTLADPLSRETTYEYDGLGRQTKVTQPDPDGAGAGLAPWTVYAYDDAGNLLSVADRLSHATTYGYDAIGRKISETDANSDTTEYTYDNAGYLASLTDPESNETSWIYNDIGQILTETNELSNTRSFEYDAMGLLVEKTDRNGLVIEYTYDYLGNLTGELWKNGVTTVHEFTYTYDNLGRLLTASDANASYGFEYDTADRVVEETQTLDGLTPTIVLTSQYDVFGNRTQLATSIGGTDDAVTDYTYDGFGRLESIQQDGVTGGNVVAEKRIDYTYDAAGQWDTITRYADLAATDLVATGDYGYDLTGRLISLDYTKGATSLVEYDWTFDEGNNMTDMEYVYSANSSFDYTVDYTNDDTGQLTAADYDNVSIDDEAYTYDDNGNRVTANGDTYTTGTNNRLLSDDTYYYAYDDEGNRILKFVDNDSSGTLTSGDTDITEYEWDYRNRLTTVSTFDDYTDYVAVDPSQVVEYTYDYQNRLIGKTLDSDGDGTVDSSVVYVQDGNQIVAQFDKTGTGDAVASDLSHRYLWGAAVDQLLADEVVDNLATAGDVIWPLVDHLNTTRDLAEYDDGTDTTTIANHRVFDAYGNITDETAPAVDCLFGFTGRLFDTDTVLQNNLNRWYDATVGRWLSEDPIGFVAGDYNLNRYVVNTPMDYVDPTGLHGTPVQVWDIEAKRIVTIYIMPSQGLPPGYLPLMQSPIFTNIPLPEPVVRPGAKPAGPSITGYGPWTGKPFDCSLGAFDTGFMHVLFERTVYWSDGSKTNERCLRTALKGQNGPIFRPPPGARPINLPTDPSGADPPYPRVPDPFRDGPIRWIPPMPKRPIPGPGRR